MFLITMCPSPSGLTKRAAPVLGTRGLVLALLTGLSRGWVVRSIAALALVGGGATTASAVQYEYKLFQYKTSTMTRSIEEFATTNPTWEIVSMTSLSFQDRGSVSILILARREVAPPPAPINPRGEVPVPPATPSRVAVSAAPEWAKSSGYADAAAVAINAKLAPILAGGRAERPATVDVVIDETGAIQFVSARSGKATKALKDAAVAAVNGVGSFGGIPAGVEAGNLTDRSFTFAVRP